MNGINIESSLQGKTITFCEDELADVRVLYAGKDQKLNFHSEKDRQLWILEGRGEITLEDKTGELFKKSDVFIEGNKGYEIRTETKMVILEISYNHHEEYSGEKK